MSFLTVRGALGPTHRQTDLRSGRRSEGRRTSYLTQLEGRTRVPRSASAWCRPRAARVGCIPSTPQSYHRAHHNCDTRHLRSSQRICPAPARTSRTPREDTRSKRFAFAQTCCMCRLRSDSVQTPNRRDETVGAASRRVVCADFDFVINALEVRDDTRTVSCFVTTVSFVRPSTVCAVGKKHRGRLK